MKAVLTTLIILILITVTLGIGFGLQYLGLINYSFFAPKYENARREVFENTQSYVEGKRQELQKYKLEYIREKDETIKQAIASTILHSFANIDLNTLSIEDSNFIRSLSK